MEGAIVGFECVGAEEALFGSECVGTERVSVGFKCEEQDVAGGGAGVGTSRGEHAARLVIDDVAVVASALGGLLAAGLELADEMSSRTITSGSQGEDEPEGLEDPRNWVSSSSDFATSCTACEGLVIDTVAQGCTLLDIRAIFIKR